jgi:undecaprenyl-diphosphatase
MATLTAHSADSLIVIPVLALVWFFSSEKTLINLLIAAYVCSVLLTTIVKFTVRRKRPPGDWGQIYRKTDPYSFPSGHAARTIALSTIFFSESAVIWGLASLLWAAMVGLARIALGVHYLSDVAAGYLLGILTGIGVYFILPLTGLI